MNLFPGRSEEPKSDTWSKVKVDELKKTTEPEGRKRKREGPEQIWLREVSRSTGKQYYRNLLGQTAWKMPKGGRIIEKKEERAEKKKCAEDLKGQMKLNAEQTESKAKRGRGERGGRGKSKGVSFKGLGDEKKQDVNVAQTLEKVGGFPPPFLPFFLPPARSRPPHLPQLTKFMASDKKFTKASKLFVQLIGADGGLVASNSGECVLSV
jgi:hypothetical protein